MSFLHFYVRNRQAILPTVALTADGFYMDVEPVRVFDLYDVEAMREALLEALAAGNPRVPTPGRADEPGSVILDAVGVRRWEAFEKTSALYTLHADRAKIDFYATGRGADGMWVEEEALRKTFPADTPLETVVRIVVAEVVRHTESLSMTRRTPLLLPPPRE